MNSTETASEVPSATNNGSPSPRPGSERDHRRWRASLETVIELLLLEQGAEQAPALLDDLLGRLREAGLKVPSPTSTPYRNTIPRQQEPEYPGDAGIERRLRSYMRWNAMAMVVNGERSGTGVGGHISSYASAATLYEVGYNHFFRGDEDGGAGDLIFFQGHTTPGNYARAFLEGRLSVQHLQNFRRELGAGGGLSSYPHPYLMPEFWQFPTVSMGLGPIVSIYTARFIRYLHNRGLLPPERNPKIWAFVGDGESDEPETLGALTAASRENLENLIWVVNCNLQRLDGPVRGNGKIIQELEGMFRGAGWNVIKVIWGGDWDDLLARDTSGLLLQRMSECVDGDFQKYVVESGGYIRTHFFGKYPELLDLVNHLSDQQLWKLMRGGHDHRKVYAAYHAAVNHKGQPTVILAKTIKGYGLGEAAEGRNISHQQKKMNEKELREFRQRFDIPISDEEIADVPFYRPDPQSPEMQYLFARRKALGGFVPKRRTQSAPLPTPALEVFQRTLKGSDGREASTTMAFVDILRTLLRDAGIGKHVVPIVPDEARTFGIEALFKEFGIFSTKGQLYIPQDANSLTPYIERKDGQILEEGISEAGSISSFIAAGTSYSTHGVPMIPFYIYYSMFGFQRVGDLVWLAADSRCRGFLLGATSGRTSLNGEGLQHQDGHSQLMASTVPTLYSYDPAFAYELAVIIADGMKRMYRDGEDIFYYLSVYNDNYVQPAMPAGIEDSILQGLYRFRPGADAPHKAHLLASGSIMRSALRAQELLVKYGVSADVWSVTSWKQLRTDALRCQRWNMLHPTEKPRVSYLESTLAGEQGAFVAVSDNLRLVHDQIAPWIPGGLFSLGTEGFGRSESRENLRRFFEIDAESTVIATLYQLSRQGKIPAATVSQAIKDLGVDPEKVQPQIV